MNLIALASPNVSYANFLIDLMIFTAAIPLFAISTFLIALFPSVNLTNSSTVGVCLLCVMMISIANDGDSFAYPKRTFCSVAQILQSYSSPSYVISCFNQI